MNFLLSKELSRPLSIRGRSVSKRIMLAPMAGLGHIALRQLITGFGGFGLLFTGMCSAKAVPHENPSISPVFNWRQEELSHTVCQIFGPDPDCMAIAAERIEKEGFFGVDLNFGCSVSAICKKGCGAALLKTPQKASQIVKTVRERISAPLFVKFRTGWENDPGYATDMARRFEDAGADALTFHPRVAPDRRNRPPQWPVIKQVQKAVSIPVFGNGNVFTESDAARMLSQTGCQGLSIGRMAVARPWIFASWSNGFIPPENIYQITALRMAEFLESHYNDHFSVKLFKKFSPYFCANFKFGHQMLKQLVRAQTMTEIKANIDALFQSVPETLSRPNPHLFL